MTQPAVEPKPKDKKDHKTLKDLFPGYVERVEQRRRERHSKTRDFFTLGPERRFVSDLLRNPVGKPSFGYNPKGPAVGKFILKHGIERPLSFTAETGVSTFGGPFEKETGLIPLQWGKGLKRGSGPLGLGGFIPTTKEDALFGKVWASPEFARAKPESVEALKSFVGTGMSGGISPEAFKEMGRAYRTMWEQHQARPISEQIILGLIDPIGTFLTTGLGAPRIARALGKVPAAARGAGRAAQAVPGRAKDFVTPKLPAEQQLAFADFAGQGAVNLAPSSPMQDIVTSARTSIEGMPGNIRDIPSRFRRMFSEKPVSFDERYSDPSPVERFNLMMPGFEDHFTAGRGFGPEGWLPGGVDAFRQGLVKSMSQLPDLAPGSRELQTELPGIPPSFDPKIAKQTITPEMAATESELIQAMKVAEEAAKRGIQPDMRERWIPQVIRGMQAMTPGITAERSPYLAGGFEPGVMTGKAQPITAKSTKQTLEPFARWSMLGEQGTSEQIDIVKRVSKTINGIPQSQIVKKMADVEDELKRRLAESMRKIEEIDPARLADKDYIDQVRKAEEQSLSGRYLVNPKLKDALNAAISPDEQANLLKFVNDSREDGGRDAVKPILTFFDGLNARNALKDLFDLGKIPTASETIKLQKVLGDDFTKSITKLISGSQPMEVKMMMAVMNILNFPRASKSSVDLSFLLRQGGMLAPREFNKVRRAAGLAVQTILPGGEDLARQLQWDMMKAKDSYGRLLYPKYVQKSELFQHTLGPAGRLAPYQQIEEAGIRGGVLGEREEAFLSTWASIIFPWVRGSERAYATFLNKLRWDTMDDIVRKSEVHLGENKAGLGNELTDETLNNLAKYINAATGRGPMPKDLKFITEIMNAFLFSPRLLTSRFAAPIYAGKAFYGLGKELMASGMSPDAFQILRSKLPVNAKILGAGDEITDISRLTDEAIKGNPAALNAYKVMVGEVARQMAAWFGMGMTFMILAKAAHETGLPVDVGLDPRSSNFGKIRVGNVRADIWSGYSQIARALYQLSTSLVDEAETISVQTGKIRPTSAEDIIRQFVRSKFAPTVGVGFDYNIIPFTSGHNESWGKGVGYLGEDRKIFEDMQDLKGFVSGSESSFWTQLLTPLFIADVVSAISDVQKPFDMASDIREHNPEYQTPGIVRGILEVAGTGALGLTGVAVQTYTTKEDIARAFTGTQPGLEQEFELDIQARRGAPGRSYLSLHNFQQDYADDIQRRSDERQGITRTLSFSGRMHALKQKELVDKLNSLAISAPSMSSRQVSDNYYTITRDFRTRRDQMIRDEFGVEDERRLALIRSQMNPSQAYVQDFYDILDNARAALEAQGQVTGIPAEDYRRYQSEWERIMAGKAAGGDSGALAAIYALRMNTHLVEIPLAILSKLSPQTRQSYKFSQDLRTKYLKGELDNLFKWEEQMYTTD